MFLMVLEILQDQGLLRGKTIGIDATTLEANAALRSIVRRDDGTGYEDFLKGLAKESGIETPTRADLAKIDKKRPRKGSNEDWEHPHDPDAQITKMKDGRTHLAHKVEHGVDMDSGAVMAVTLEGGAAADSQTLSLTMAEVSENVMALGKEAPKEWVADKGYHCNETMELMEEFGLRGYISEPDRGRRTWKGKETARDGTYANRRRIRGGRGKRLMRQRGEKLERGFAHCLETGGMRRVWLRGHGNILKRYLIHVAGFNLGLVMRKLLCAGTPRGLAAPCQSSLGPHPPARKPHRRDPRHSRGIRRDLRPESHANAERTCAPRRDPLFNGLLENGMVRAYETGAAAELRKWIARNRALAATAAAAALVVTLGSTGASVVLAGKNRELGVAHDAASDKARELALQSYENAIAAADGALAAGDVPTARQYLEQAAPEQRGWEWRYLAARADSSQSTLYGHAGAVRCVAADASGTLLASYGDDQLVRLWDAAARRELRRLPLPGPAGRTASSFDRALTLGAALVEEADGTWAVGSSTLTSMSTSSASAGALRGVCHPRCPPGPAL